MWKILLELALVPYVIFGWLAVIFALLMFIFCIIEAIKTSRKR